MKKRLPNTDITFKGHSVTNLIKKTNKNLKKNGLKATSKKGGIFLARQTGLFKLLPKNPNRHISPRVISDWYENHSKKVTIVIPSYNDYPLLKKCVKSIHKTTLEKKVKIIVVDDYCAEDNRKRLVKLESGNVSVIFRDKNGGFAKAVNTGMKAAPKNSDIILINSDTEMKKGWLQSLQYGAYKYDNKSGIVGAKLLYPNGTIQFAGTFRNTEQPEWFDHRYRSEISSFGPANVPQQVLAITGACMYIKREVIDKIGYLDEKYGMAFEDVDYCLRAWKAGFRSLYFPNATLIHHESLTRGKKQGKRELDSKDYFWSKWGDFFDNRKVIGKNGKPRIIYVLKTTGVSGGIKMVFKHLNNLSERGYEVELYSLDKDPDWIPLNVKHRSFKDFSQLIDTLSKQDAIKVATWWETSQPVWLGSVTRGIPVFYVQDIETSYYPNDTKMQNVVLSNYKKEFTYLTISQWDADELLKLGIKSTNIGCGIDLDLFYPIKNTKREDDVLVALGRGEPLKNFALTMNGWKRIESKKRPRLWLFGVEPDIVKANDKVTYFTKPTDKEINELYNKATVFTQTSRHEGFCLTALEAMAAGAIVVTTNSDGNLDYSVNNKNCLMIEQDNPVDMKEKLERVLSDKELRDRLRREGYKTAKQYGWPKITDKLEDFYKKVSS